MRSSTSILRRRAARRFVFHTLLWFVFPLAAVLFLRLVWGWEADRRLQTLRVRLHDQGLKVYPTDFPDDKALPHADNAIYDLKEASLMAGSLAYQHRAPPLRIDLSGRLDLARTPQEAADLQALYAAYLPVIAKLDDALSRPQAVWPRPSPSFRSSDYSVLRFAEDMSNLLCHMAILAHGAHDDAQALRQLCRLWRLSRTLGETPYFVGRGNQVDLTALTTLECLAPELDLQPPAVDALARQVLAILHDDDWYQRTAAAATQQSICAWFEPPLREAGSYGTYSGLYWLLAPLTRHHAACTIEGLVARVALVQAADWPHGKAAFPAPGVAALGAKGVPTRTRLDALVGVTAYYPDGAPVFESIARCRAVAVLLAARLYAERHGAPPNDLSRLVPEILPHTPLDPFDPAGLPLRYRLINGIPTAWSVGPNGVDDFGGAAAKSDDLVYGEGHFKMPPLPVATAPARP